MSETYTNHLIIFMKYIYYSLLVLFLAGSCKNKTPEVPAIEACGVKDPVQHLDWLKTRIDEAKANKTENMLKVTLVNVDGKQIINYQLEYMACLGCYAYNCDGSPFDTFKLSDAERTAFHQNVWGEKGNRVILWPENKSH